jgi:heterotetrameric sarcosine oxidase gamma subunit
VSKAEPAPQSMLAHALASGRHGAGGAHPVAIAERRIEIVQLTARKGAAGPLAAAARDLVGGDLPAAGRALVSSEVMAVSILPGSWLVTAPWRGNGDLAGRLAAAIGTSAAIVDQSFGKASVTLSGRHARDVLAKGCRIDLHPRVFVPGQAAVTPIAHISCVLVQTGDEPSFELIVPAGLAASFVEWLTTSAAEYGYVVP